MTKLEQLADLLAQAHEIYVDLIADAKSVTEANDWRIDADDVERARNYAREQSTLAEVA